MAVGLGGGGGGGGYMAKSKIMAKVKYDFSTNKGRNKCNTSFLSNFENPFLILFLSFKVIFNVKGSI